VAEAEVIAARSYEQVRSAVLGGAVTPRGLGRSYGDSALGDRVLELTGLDHFIAFDAATGSLTCEAGVSLAEVLAAFVPRGWFLPVTPGTKYVTVGGAVASDVHGKNHHKDGTFGDHVTSLRLMVASGEVLDVSRESHPELFHATCGGMGLTGVILEVTFRLKRVRSRFVDETVIKAPTLDAAIEAFDEHGSATYSVGWIDLVASGRRLGRSLVMVGEHADDGNLAGRRGGPMAAVPLEMPGALLNPLSVKAFNTLYYERIRGTVTQHRVGYEPYFYPLDKLADWNKLYGRAGFLQYQFAVPFSGRAALQEAVRRITEARLASPLAVLKVFGPANDNLLSFPMAGYTLALDFKVDDRALRLCDELDRLVLGAGGRVYLTKDARMSAATLRASYPRLEEFEKVRREYGAEGVFTSAQWKRWGLS